MMFAINKGLLYAAVLGLLSGCNGGKPAAPSAVTEAAAHTVSDGQASDVPTSAAYADRDHSAENALDWAGSYQARLPCGDCDHIRATVVLNDDQTFHYLLDHRGGKRPLKVEKSGRFEWDGDGSVAVLKTDEGDLRFFVAENHLQPLAPGSTQYRSDSLHNLQKQ